ncbi:MAG: hypothetical protein A4E61_00244 [Syntrophorhabdus sp. PtaB.Bin184]|nr:MAG: hypothetical protein A4E61_00244 [Syntrophorhabdus sp. PtaB.Bin184]
MNSVLSFPERGNYGKSSWRGNVSGHVIGELLNFFRPGLFVDPAEGSGTSRDVAREKGIEYVGLDLHEGFNLIRDSLIGRLPRPADYVFFHPPYHDMVLYSGNVWGSQPHPDDLSRCRTRGDFLAKLEVALLNIYDATRRGGHYSVMIGDLRRNGDYWSIQSDIMQIAPGRLEGILVKVQHGATSSRACYGGLFIPIMHEYILNFKKDGCVVGMIETGMAVSRKLADLQRATWRAIVEFALTRLGERPVSRSCMTLSKRTRRRGP